MESHANEFPVLGDGTIIVMMGLPSAMQIRTWFDQAIARWVQSPSLKQIVVLDTLSEEEGYDTNNNPSEEDAARLRRVSFDVILRLGLSTIYFPSTRCVIIDSLIYSTLQLTQLLKNVCQTEDLVAGRFLIIEWKRKNKFLWQQSVETMLSKRSQMWYEPKNWSDVEEAICKSQDEGSDDDFLKELNNYSSKIKTFKLVVDPSEDINERDFFIPGKNSNRRALFMEAIRKILTRDTNKHGEESYVVNYPLWRRQLLEEEGRSFACRVTTPKHYRCYHGDCIFRFRQKPDGNDVEICDVCDKSVAPTEEAYYCQSCSLSFHESCATLNDFTGSIGHDISEFLDSEKVRSYACIDTKVFPNTHSCHSCIEGGNEFSSQCSSCLFETHLKCQLLPTVLSHDCDKDHFLSILLRWNIFYFSSCKACGLIVPFTGYSCNVCRSDYHLECLTLPLQMENQHGGHLHSIKIQFSCEKEDEYEWCNVCYKDIDPKTWVYTCLDCDHVAHLYCIFRVIRDRYQGSTL